MDKILIVPAGNFYHHEFSGYPGADRVHPVIFANLIWTVQEIRNEINTCTRSWHWMKTNMNVGCVGEVGMRITGFTRLHARTLELKVEQEKEVKEGKRKKVTVSMTSTHEVENGGCALDFEVFFIDTKKVFPTQLVAQIISPKKWLYDFMLPHFNDFGKYYDPYNGDHVHMDRRKLAVKLGLRK